MSEIKPKYMKMVIFINAERSGPLETSEISHYKAQAFLDYGMIETEGKTPGQALEYLARKVDGVLLQTYFDSILRQTEVDETPPE